MDTIFMFIVTAISVILGTIIFVQINKHLSIAYFGFGKIVTTWGICVITIFIAVLAISQKLGILDLVAK